MCQRRWLGSMLVGVLCLAGVLQATAEDRQGQCRKPRKEFGWMACGPIVNVSPEVNEITIMRHQAPPGFPNRLTFRIGWLSRLFLTDQVAREILPPGSRRGRVASVGLLRPGDWAEIEFFELNENVWRVFEAHISRPDDKE